MPYSSLLVFLPLCLHNQCLSSGPREQGAKSHPKLSRFHWSLIKQGSFMDRVGPTNQTL
jgi:hypothetical protein